jgi:hypothetical protein
MGPHGITAAKSFISSDHREGVVSHRRLVVGVGGDIRVNSAERYRVRIE